MLEVGELVFLLVVGSGGGWRVSVVVFVFRCNKVWMVVVTENGVLCNCLKIKVFD